MSKDNGGPAFPVPGWPDDESFNGMTLRDYFAAKAMQFVHMPTRDCSGELNNSEKNRLRAYNAYKMADAMIAERNKK